MRLSSHGNDDDSIIVQNDDDRDCCWAEARIKIARMTLTIELDRNWNSFQLANSAPPLSVTDSAIAPSARMLTAHRRGLHQCTSAKGPRLLAQPRGSISWSGSDPSPDDIDVTPKGVLRLTRCNASATLEGS